MVRPEQSLRPEILFDHPEDSPDEEGLRRAADLLAKILDTAIEIPGTNIRIGLDPLLGLIPGIGDALSSLIGSWMLVIASQLHVPKIVMTRMALNIFLNGSFGTLPVVGDLFSVWFKSNARNAVLLRRHSAKHQRPSTNSDWLFVIGIIVITCTLTLGIILGLLWVVARLWALVQ